jgi:hypothetical protein
MPLREKIDLIQSDMEISYFADRPIPCCMPFDGGAVDTPRPWKLADFSGQSTPRFRANKPGRPVQVTAADWLNNENSSSLTGEYLLSQALRYECTKEEAALEQCHKAINALQTIAQLPGPDRFGWVCKPFGARASLESSPDQNICVLAGLQAYLPHADAKQSKWIGELVRAIPRYWDKIQYRIDFGDHEWDLREDVAHMRIFHAAAVFSHHLSRSRDDAALARRLFNRYQTFGPRSASLFDTFTAMKSDYFAQWCHGGEFAGATLLFVPLVVHLLSTVGFADRKWSSQTLRRCLDHGVIGLDPTWFGHYYHHEVRRSDALAEYVWRPLTPAQPDALSHYRSAAGGWMLFEYPSRLFWFDATARLPLAYMIYLHAGGSALPRIDRIVREIMGRLDYARLHWMVDLHNDQTPPELQFLLHAQTSEAPMYLAAYWMGCKMNFWKQ